MAFAAHRLGVPAAIFVPSVAAVTKQDRIRSLGAELVVAGERYADALAASHQYAERTGALEIHAFDQLETLLGQGSVGLELEEQCPSIDTLIVAVGGGGLLGGIAAWFRGRGKLVAVEPRAAPTLYRALEAGHPVDAEAGGIAADSLAPRRVGELMFPLAQQFVDRVVLVEDDAIRAAQQALWQVMRIAAEPGGAAATAALLSGAYTPRGRARRGAGLRWKHHGRRLQPIRFAFAFLDVDTHGWRCTFIHAISTAALPPCWLPVLDAALQTHPLWTPSQRGTLPWPSAWDADDPNYVDAYYGPDSLRTAAQAESLSVTAILGVADVPGPRDWATPSRPTPIRWSACGAAISAPSSARWPPGPGC